MKFDRLNKRNLKHAGRIAIDDAQLFKEDFFDEATGDFFESAIKPTPDQLNIHLLAIHKKGNIFVNALYNTFHKEFD